MVVIVAVLALALGSTAVALLMSSSRASVQLIEHVVSSIEPPKSHLLAAERFNDSGQAALTAAVAASGDERTRLLSEAVAHSQETSSEWTKYRATAAGLPGERELAARYEADQAAASATSSAALVPILNSTVAGALPQAEVATHEQVRADLIALHNLYRQAGGRALGTLDERGNHLSMMIGALAGLALLLTVAASVVSMRVARRSVVDRRRQASAGELAKFETRLRRALEFIDTDAAAFAVAERAMNEILPDARPSLLIADASHANLTPVGDAPTCGVTNPNACPALRSASTLNFADSSALDACPVLANNVATPCSATCVPITIAGRGAGIMHLAGPIGAPPDHEHATGLVARGVGERVTLLQAFATFQLQAERDPLTGLLNRRSLESAVVRVIDAGKPYAVAFGDLDHFKRLNDLHGHDAGDRALRAFSRVLRESVRPEDIVCRWGGEEFVIVLPGCDTQLAAEAMERVRTNLTLGAMVGQAAVVTASFGVAQSSDAESFDEVVERADAALRRAKDDGRNRVVSFESVAAPI